MTKITTILSNVLAPNQNERVATIATRDDFLTAEECSDIIRIGGEQENEPGTLGPSKETNSTIRNSDTVYLFQNESTYWIYEKIDRAIQAVNDDAYQYHISGLEPLQLATYTEGNHYDWHTDLGQKEHSTRKISLSVQLSASDEYDGGDIEFMKVAEPTSRDQGSVIFFPSFYFHRVTPVTRGCRRSLVAWVHGNAFR